jgi:competence protein ComEC
MSFAATLALVVLVETGMPRLLAAADSSLAARAALWGGREVAMLAAASLVAGLATTPYAAFHFHRLAPYGVIANLAAMPVVSGLVMPAGLAGLAAAPFGLDGPCWLVMGVGIEWMVTIATAVAALPGAVGRVPAFGSGALLVMSAGILLLGLLRTRLRLAGLAVLMIGIGWALAAPRPDILVSADGGSVAVRGPAGGLRVMRTRNDAFTVREWLAADADARAAGDPSLSAGVSCDQAGCVVPARGAALVALAKRPEALADDCARAAVLVTSHQPPPACGALAIDAARLARDGALALRASDDGFIVETARPRGSRRPWYGAARRDDGPHPGSDRPGAPAAVDATPPVEAEQDGAVR